MSGVNLPDAMAGVDFSKVAVGCGWEHVIRCATHDACCQALTLQPETDGPRLIVGDAEAALGGVGPRSPGKAAPRAAAFSEAVAQVVLGATH